jgi:hypothetical protein
MDDAGNVTYIYDDGSAVQYTPGGDVRDARGPDVSESPEEREVQKYIDRETGTVGVKLPDDTTMDLTDFTKLSKEYQDVALQRGGQTLSTLIKSNSVRLPDDVYINKEDYLSMPEKYRKIADREGLDAANQAIDEDNSKNLAASVQWWKDASKEGLEKTTTVLEDKEFEDYQKASPNDKFKTLQSKSMIPPDAKFDKMDDEGFIHYTTIQNPMSTTEYKKAESDFGKLSQDDKKAIIRTALPMADTKTFSRTDLNKMKKEKPAEYQAILNGTRRNNFNNLDDEEKSQVLNFYAGLKGQDIEIYNLKRGGLAAASLLPVVGTVLGWNSMSTTWKAISVAGDLLMFVPIGKLPALAKTVVKGAEFAKLDDALTASAKVERATLKTIAPELVESHEALTKASKSYGNLLVETKDLQKTLKGMSETSEVGKELKTRLNALEPQLEPSRQNVIKKAQDLANAQAKLATVKGGYDDASTMVQAIRSDLPRDTVKNIETTADRIINPPKFNLNNPEKAVKQIEKVIVKNQRVLDTASAIEADRASDAQKAYTAWNKAGRPKTGELVEKLRNADNAFNEAHSTTSEVRSAIWDLKAQQVAVKTEKVRQIYNGMVKAQDEIKQNEQILRDAIAGERRTPMAEKDYDSIIRQAKKNIADANRAYAKLATEYKIATNAMDLQWAKPFTKGGGRSAVDLAPSSPRLSRIGEPPGGRAITISGAMSKAEEKRLADAVIQGGAAFSKEPISAARGQPGRISIPGQEEPAIGKPMPDDFGRRVIIVKPHLTVEAPVRPQVKPETPTINPYHKPGLPGVDVPIPKPGVPGIDVPFPEPFSRGVEVIPYFTPKELPKEVVLPKPYQKPKVDDAVKAIVKNMLDTGTRPENVTKELNKIGLSPLVITEINNQSKNKNEAKQKIEQQTNTRILSKSETKAQEKVKSTTKVKIKDTVKTGTETKLNIKVVPTTRLKTGITIKGNDKIKIKKPVPKPKPDLTDKEKRKVIKEAGGAIAFRMGQLNKKDIWHVIVDPYTAKENYLVVVGRTPQNANIVRGPKSAYKTAQLLYGHNLNRPVNIDAGITDVRLDPIGGKRVRISFTGDPRLQTTGDFNISDRGRVFPLRQEKTAR